MGYWMELGLSGFRVDAVPFLIETKRQQDTVALPDPHDYLADLAAFLRRRNGESVLLGEVNLPYPDLMAFFGVRDGGGSTDELTMCFDFIGMQQMYLSLARADAEPLADALRQRPDPPEDGHWATFVRNHDELTLDKLTDAQRKEVFDAFGPTRTCRSTGAACAAGCRRCSTATSAGSGWSTACCSRCPARRCCSTARRSGWARTWPSRAGSRCAPRCSGRRSRAAGSPPPTRRRSRRPSRTDEFGPKQVNVRDQQRDPDSLLSWIRLLVEQLPGVPRAGLGRPTRCSTRARTPGRCWPTAATPRAAPCVALHNFADAEVEAAPVLAGLAGRRAHRRARPGGPAGVGGPGRPRHDRPAAVRMPLVAHGVSR